MEEYRIMKLSELAVKGAGNGWKTENLFGVPYAVWE